MNNVRIFSCGDNLTNFNKCMEENIIGFRHMFSESIKGDTVYISLKVNKISCCYARATVGAVTNIVPWDEPEKYQLCHKITNIEFCTPFSLNFLKETSAKKHWGMVFIIGSRIIRDKKALTLLDEHFEKNKCDTLYDFSSEEICHPKQKHGRKKKITNIDAITYSVAENMAAEEITDLESIMGADDNSKFDIMGTFKIVKFKNETDKNKGLEPLVSSNFYKLFNFFEENNSILIPENRLFNTKTGTTITGIPDALLITFDSDRKASYLKIHIIEYECYVEYKTRSTDKFNYLNGNIIPQLIRFASTFSVVTDSAIRNDTIKSWIDKIINYIDNDETLEEKIHLWLKEVNPRIKTSHIISDFRAELEKAFCNNIQIVLVIDELTSEQRETIKNIINSFKLSDSSKKEIDFAGYVVRLEHLLNYDKNTTSQYALSFQDN